MTGFIFPIFNFLHNNVYARYAALAALIYAIIRGKEEIDEARGRRQRDAENAKAQVRETQRATENQTTLQKEASHEADEALSAGRDAARSGVLSERAIARTLGRRSPPE